MGRGMGAAASGGWRDEGLEGRGGYANEESERGSGAVGCCAVRYEGRGSTREVERGRRGALAIIVPAPMSSRVSDSDRLELPRPSCSLVPRAPASLVLPRPSYS